VARKFVRHVIGYSTVFAVVGIGGDGSNERRSNVDAVIHRDFVLIVGEDRRVVVDVEDFDVERQEPLFAVGSRRRDLQLVGRRLLSVELFSRLDVNVSDVVAILRPEIKSRFL
jgi:hypothetical protein